MDITLLPAQYDLLTSEEPTAALVAGIGYGKSYTLAHFVLKMAVNFPNSQGLIVANTYTQLQNATLPAITALLDELNIPYSLIMGGAKKHLNIGKTRILIYSLENYETIRGIEVGWLVADELSRSKREALDVVFGRLRQRNSPLQARFFTSPAGFNWFYDYINEQNVAVFTGKTIDNYNLPPDYYQRHVDMFGLDSPFFKQEMEGQFINQVGLNVYYSFDRLKHLAKLQENKHMPVYVTCDFNVGNMTYNAIQYDKDGFKVLESIVLKDHNANTFSMAAEICQKYGNRAIVIPDSTGNARKTSSDAGLTDIRILQNMGLKVEFSNNPRIKDRQNSVNAAFFKNRIVINDTCIDLVKELETLSLSQDEGKVSHNAVSMGYLVHKLEPIITYNTKQLSNPFLKRK